MLVALTRTRTREFRAKVRPGSMMENRTPCTTEVWTAVLSLLEAD
jgi:hypothetical protein